MARRAAVVEEPEVTAEEEAAILGTSNDDMEDHRPDDETEETTTESETKETTSEEEESEGEEAADDKPIKTVPHGALHEERARRKLAEGNFQSLQERHNLLEQRMNLILQRMMAPQQEQQQQEQVPDKNADPFAYMEWLEKRLNTIEQGQQQQTQQAERQQQESEIIRVGNTLAAQVRAKDPEEYDAALSHLVTRRVAELRALGTPEHQIQPLINTEMTRGMITALQQRRNPGDFMMEYAKATGFQFQKKASSNDVDRLGDAVRKNRSLDGGRGGGSGTESTVEALSRMSDDEFDAWYAKNGKKGFAKTFGT